MRILWAVSSVGKGHIMRGIAIVNRLQKMTEVEVDWLAPDPAGDFLKERGYNVLACSSELAGSGKVYEQVFKDCTDEFNLIEYVRQDTRLQAHDFRVSRQSWGSKQYDVIVGDEAFWLLSGFCSNPSEKPAPFIFLTDFIGVKAMRPRMRDMLTSWYTNFKYTMSYLGPDVNIYIGSVEEIPAERFGFLLPGRRSWGHKYCRFVKPVVSFGPDMFVDRKILRRQLGLSEEGHLFLAVVGPEGDFSYRTSQIEKIFDILRRDFPKAAYLLVGPKKSTREWIQYHRYLDKLYEYFVASDCVLIQSGYGKVTELSSLGIPFIAIPLDYHFEQEYVMAHRLEHYGVGKLVTLRDHSPDEVVGVVKEAMRKPIQRIAVDDGEEVGRIILEIVQKNNAAAEVA